MSNCKHLGRGCRYLGLFPSGYYHFCALFYRCHCWTWLNVFDCLFVMSSIKILNRSTIKFISFFFFFILDIRLLEGYSAFYCLLFFSLGLVIIVQWCWEEWFFGKRFFRFQYDSFVQLGFNHTCGYLSSLVSQVTPNARVSLGWAQGYQEKMPGLFLLTFFS